MNSAVYSTKSKEAKAEYLGFLIMQTLSVDSQAEKLLAVQGIELSKQESFPRCFKDKSLLIFDGGECEQSVMAVCGIEMHIRDVDL